MTPALFVLVLVLFALVAFAAVRRTLQAQREAELSRGLMAAAVQAVLSQEQRATAREAEMDALNAAVDDYSEILTALLEEPEPSSPAPETAPVSPTTRRRKFASPRRERGAHPIAATTPAPTASPDDIVEAVRLAQQINATPAPTAAADTGEIQLIDTEIDIEQDETETPMPIRTIGTPQPGDELMASEQRHATRVHTREVIRQQGETRKMLDVLRSTRHQRDVGTVRVPNSLNAPLVAGPIALPAVRSRE